MARRRLSRRQQRRIQHNQDAISDSRSTEPARVISHRGGLVLVEMTDGRLVETNIKSNLGSIVCGDGVRVEQAKAGEYRIMSVGERDNLLQRVDGLGQLRDIAANISQLIVCLAASPEPNLFLLDQYLLSAEQQAIDAVILFNKIDLCGDDEDPLNLREIYQPLGYRIVSTSATEGTGMAEFEALLKNRVSVISGVSGVGKSSLTSHLLPDVEIKTASLSEANEEGRHTTRTSRLYHLLSGGDLIDTPGVRGFSPYVDERFPVAQGFREIREIAAQCRFNNCQHLSEPGCAVIAALESREIAESRYQHYLKLLQQDSPR